ncbi:MAG: hypothetical protein EPN65_16540 [Pandoraea sp.]|uniref:hypothetical protein n=1 Tax=Pandoraea sp. TaxID=1883445 RepID=UPI0012054BCE|nr:hypothetical protein [Pandoraea sp.]TAM15922.1 MAG: hypothetical protein EPN65_16540 [Pandoraea sp.]
MIRPRLDHRLTRENVLSRMMPGKTYTAYAMAAKFTVPTAQVRPILDVMLKDGDIELTRKENGETAFTRSGSADLKPPAPPKVPLTSIATPPITVRFDSDLKGYGEEIDRRIALCMMVRK